MNQVKQLTAIGRIGLVKRSGSPWSAYTKKFILAEKPTFAAIRLDSAGVCGIYINGEFVEAHTGRLPNRVCYVEITSKLCSGENVVRLQLGPHYYQETAETIYHRRKAWFSYVAAELEIRLPESRLTLTTDASWECVSDDGQRAPELFSHLTQADYDRFWRHAALRREISWPIQVPRAILDVAGEGYAAYTAKPEPAYVWPEKIIATNMTREPDGSLVSRISDMGALYIYEEREQPFVTYALRRMEVGYLELEYESDQDGDAVFLFDYSESPDDLEENSRYWNIVRRLSLRVPLKQGSHTLRLLHRRAFRFLKITFAEKYRTIRIRQVRLRRSLTHTDTLGWFHCSDQLMNEAWEISKYTLQVNKHQEYESCPRHEMKFFVGDGLVDGLIDYYTFGDLELMDASLAITELEGDSGLRHDVYDKNTGLWDYPSLRIITAYNHYLYSGDREFLAHYYPEMVMGLLWNIEKMGENDLIYQYPVGGDCFYATSGAVEWNCSFDRLGEKPSLNALLYRSLICMSELAEIMEDKRGPGWYALAQAVKKAINDRLWSEEVGAYIDTYDPSFIPQDGNAMALQFGVADTRRAKLALDTLRRENWSQYGSALLSKEVDHTRGGSRTISPFMCCHEAAARFLCGDAEGGLELIRRCWGTMLKKGARTFWEFVPNNGTERWPIPAHAWAGGPAYLLSAFVLGVRPAKPGYEVLHFEPYGGYESFAGVVPTVKGLVAVNCHTEADRLLYTLAVPASMEVEAVLPENALLTVREYIP